jgi:zona occludens toxin (predicted ATPase)
MRPSHPKFVLLTVLFATFVLSSFCLAQTDEQQPSFDSAIAVARANMQADKATIISAAMQFNEQEGAAFWPIYRQYEHERAMLDDGRVSVIKEYTQKYPNLTDAEAKDMAERVFEYDTRLAALKKTYYKKFNKVLPALTVTKFFQLDRRVDLLVDMQVESSLPPLTNAQFAKQGKEPVTPTPEQ